MTSNKISNKGAIYILNLKQLSNLYLSHNKVQAIIGLKLVELPEMKVLDLRFNDMNKEEKQAIKQKCNTNIQLFL